jgi:hypothetical protein
MAEPGIKLDEKFQTKLTNFIKLAFVAAFRIAFGSKATPDEYRYDKDDSKTKIKIYRAYPRRLESTPVIWVSIVGGDVSLSYLGDDSEIIVEDSDEVFFHGMAVLNVQITIVAQSLLDRDMITDLVVLCIRHLFRAKFQGLDIAFTRMTLGSETEEVEGEAILYKNTINIPCTTEYKNAVSRQTFDMIQSISLTDIQDIIISEVSVA